MARLGKKWNCGIVGGESGSVLWKGGIRMPVSSKSMKECTKVVVTVEAKIG